MFEEDNQISPLITSLIEKLGDDEFVSVLAKSLKEVLNCDSMVVMQYSDNALPDVIFDGIRELKYRAFQDIYLKGAYLLSPLYIAHRQRKFGAFTFSNLIPEGFYQSEYYQSYYSKCGLTDQLICLIELEQQQTLAISLGLLSGQYNEQQQTLFIRLRKLLFSLIKKHWQIKQQPPKQSLKNQLQNSFDLFASSTLTKREQAVVKTLMQGHSSKSAAKVLNISVDTERSYRKSAYAKLGISSQSELFSLFFSCLTLADQSPGEDPFLLFEQG